VLERNDYVILGKKVDIKRAMTKEKTRTKLMDEKYRKMFLYGLKKTVSQSKLSTWLNFNRLDDLVGYFSHWGKIEECKIYFENTNKKGGYKGYGFILFSKKETMPIVLQEDEFHTIKGCKFQCKPILLKDELKKVKEEKNFDSGPSQ
jgi:hypothetical protein